MNAPLHVSARWSSISELFINIAEAALVPVNAFPKLEEEPVDRTSLYVAASVGVVAAMTVYYIWRHRLLPNA
jgi:mitochondrial Rho GTPase 1